jgi:hypothetical protein
LQVLLRGLLGAAGRIALLGATACAVDSQEHNYPEDVESTGQALQAAEGENANSNSDERRSPPPVANPDAQHASRPGPIPGLTPDLMAALELAYRVSDTADYDYEMALHGLRANARENAQRLRQALGQLPAEAHDVRQVMISMLGGVGDTVDDANLLEQYALAPDASRALSIENPAEAENREVTKWTALFSLARMRERAESASNDAIMRVLGQADAAFARTLFIELEVISGVQSPTYRDVLQRRGISTTYTVPSGVTPLDMEPLPSDAMIPPPATN